MPYNQKGAREKLEHHKHTRVVCWYTPIAKLFLKCKPGMPLSEARIKADPYNHIITAWELNLKPEGKYCFKLATLPDPSRDQIEEWVRFAEREAE